MFCPFAKSDGATAPIVPGPVYQAAVPAYDNEHYHDTGATGNRDANKGNTKGELSKDHNAAAQNGVFDISSGSNGGLIACLGWKCVCISLLLCPFF